MVLHQKKFLRYMYIKGLSPLEVMLLKRILLQKPLVYAKEKIAQISWQK